MLIDNTVSFAESKITESKITEEKEIDNMNTKLISIFDKLKNMPLIKFEPITFPIPFQEIPSGWIFTGNNPELSFTIDIFPNSQYCTSEISYSSNNGYFVNSNVWSLNYCNDLPDDFLWRNECN